MQGVTCSDKFSMTFFAPHLRKDTFLPHFLLSDKKGEKPQNKTKLTRSSYIHTICLSSLLFSPSINVSNTHTALTVPHQHTWWLTSGCSRYSTHMNTYAGLLQKVHSQEAVSPACRQLAWTPQPLWFPLHLKSCL